MTTTYGEGTTDMTAQPTTTDPQVLVNLAVTAAREVAEEYGVDSDAAHGAAEVLASILTFESPAALDLMRPEVTP